MQLSQPTLELHSLCYTCWVQVVYSHLLSLYLFVLFGISSTAAQYQATWRTTSRTSTTSRCSSPSRRPCGALQFFASASLYWFLIRFVIKIHLTIYTLLFVTCVVISWYFCCIYAWLDPGAYMIARFMSFINRVLKVVLYIYGDFSWRPQEKS